MSRPEDQWRPPEPPDRPPAAPGGSRPTPRPRWMPWIIVAVLRHALLVWQAAPSGGGSKAELDVLASSWRLVEDDKVAQINYESSSGKITGEFAR